VSANIAIIYCGAQLREIGAAFAGAAERLGSRTRLLQVPQPGPGENLSPTDALATFDDLEWADGIAFGTPIGDGRPAPELIAFIEQTEPLWSSARLYDKVVTAFTDEPEHFAPDSVVRPIYETLYHWGAVIIGPRAFELDYDARQGPADPPASGGLSGPRVRTAQYRGRRLAALAGVLRAERSRREQLTL
jgi:NAD(P)H dehydrogenase (quinone)